MAGGELPYCAVQWRSAVLPHRGAGIIDLTRKGNTLAYNHPSGSTPNLSMRTITYSGGANEITFAQSAIQTCNTNQQAHFYTKAACQTISFKYPNNLVSHSAALPDCISGATLTRAGMVRTHGPFILRITRGLWRSPIIKILLYPHLPLVDLY